MVEFYTWSMLLSIVTFTLSTVLTPGPNNIMLLSSGLTFGYRRTIPHIFGIVLGFPFMVIVVGLGMGAIFEQFPFLFTVLKIVGIIYLFWMAYKIATNKSVYNIDDNSNNSKPFSFLQAAIFQWVNPKAWIMAITSISVFVTSEQYHFQEVFIVSFIYFLSGIISTNSWALGGVILKRFITNEHYVHIFNITMALLLVVSILPFF